MKKQLKHIESNLKRLHLFTSLIILSVPSIGIAQNSRATPGANLGVESTSIVQSEVAKLGDYVELDTSIKNDLYGSIDYPNAELKDIIKAISKLAKKNFILDRKIENRRITILSPEPVTKQEAYNAFLSALYMNDLTIVSEGKFLKIIDTKSALQSNIRVFMGDYAPNTAEVITVLYPMKFLNAEDIQRYLTDLVPRTGRIAAYPNTNTIVMTDTGFNLRRVIQIIKTIDVPGHEDQLETIPIQFGSAKDIARLIDEILNAQNGGGNSRQPRTRTTQQKTRGGGIITKIVPDERTNSLVVLANGRGLQELKDLVRQLDSSNAAGGGNIHLYYCKNAVAEELATTINSLLTGANNKSQADQPRNIPDPRILPINRNLNQNSNSSDVRFEGNLKVTADKATNSLVVVGSSSDFEALKKVLEKLDIPRRQVFVEATIMEMRIDEGSNFEVGLNVAGNGMPTVAGFIPKGSNLSLANLATSPAAFTGLLAGIAGGGSVKFKDAKGENRSINSVTGFINALVDSGQAQVLHQPQILTSDNQDAEIKVTDKITSASPSITGTGDNQVIGQTVTTTPVEVALKITPQLGENSDLIRLKVEQTLDSFTRSSSTSQIDTTNRKTTTSVVVRNGDTIAIGGLQKHTVSDNRSRIPVLGDLPIIGKLFGGTTSSSSRTTLMVLLTPRIISEYNDVLNITGEKIQNRLDLGKTAKDPEDRLRAEVLKLKKINEENKLKPAPKAWSFKPKDTIEVKDSDEIPEYEPIEPQLIEEQLSNPPASPPSALIPSGGNGA